MSRNDIDGLRVERNRCLAELAESQAMNARLARELAVASREIDRLEDELELLRGADVRVQELEAELLEVRSQLGAANLRGEEMP